MTAYIIRRLFQSVIIIVIVTMVVYLVVTLIPGDLLYIYLTAKCRYWLPGIRQNII